VWTERVARDVLVFLVLTPLVIAGAHAQVDTQTDNPAAESDFPESTSLWKVGTDSSTVYLMGSIHLLKESDYPLHPKMAEAYEEAETLVLELHMDSTNTPAFQQYLMAKAAYDSGTTLRTELPDSIYDQLNAQMETIGLDLEMMKQFEPWMIGLTFLNLKLQQLGFRPDLGVDAYFFGKAKEEGKTIEGLENPEDQIGMFDSMSPSMQQTLLLQMLEQAADIEKSVSMIVLPWKSGDLEDLDATIKKRFKEFPEVRDAIIIKRNYDWIPKIEHYIESRGTHLIIVGVTHLAGDEGVIALLRQAGYDVEQM